MQDDPTLKKILSVILEIGMISPTRAMYVCAFLVDYLQTMQEIADRFGTKPRNANKHLCRAAQDHPEIGRLMRAKYRTEYVRQRGQKRKAKI